MDKVMHFEIRVDDLARAKKFYSIFGWQAQDMPGAMQYTALTTVPTDDKFVPKEAARSTAQCLPAGKASRYRRPLPFRSARLTITPKRSKRLGARW